jgi:hypothetical protein
MTQVLGWQALTCLRIQSNQAPTTPDFLLEPAL